MGCTALDPRRRLRSQTATRPCHRPSAEMALADMTRVSVLSGAVRGRARLCVPGLRDQPGLALQLQDRLGADDRVHRVRPSTLTGNVLVLFDGRRLGLAELRRQVAREAAGYRPRRETTPRGGSRAAASAVRRRPRLAHADPGGGGALPEREPRPRAHHGRGGAPACSPPGRTAFPSPRPSPRSRSSGSRSARFPCCCSGAPPSCPLPPAASSTAPRSSPSSRSTPPSATSPSPAWSAFSPRSTRSACRWRWSVATGASASCPGWTWCPATSCCCARATTFPPTAASSPSPDSRPTSRRSRASRRPWPSDWRPRRWPPSPSATATAWCTREPS